MINYSIAKQYTRGPGPRYISEGPFSGEDFRESVLLSLIEQAQKQNTKLLIDLDGGYGYSTSFLEEAFGGAVRVLKCNTISTLLEFKSDEEPSLLEEIKEYIRAAEAKIK